LNLTRVSVFWTESIQGMVILIAMFIDAQKVRIRTRPANVDYAPGEVAPKAAPAAGAD
jgi:hypothetical protein